MDHPSRNMKDIGAKSELNSGGLNEEVSDEENFSMLPSDHFCDILVKNVAAFCPCLKSLPEAKSEEIQINCIDKGSLKKA